MDSSSGRRLVIAHNPHSSRASTVRELVFDRLDDAGYEYEVLEVRQASLADNVARLAPLIQEGDIILSAAGDGSAHAIFHSVAASNQSGVELGFLAYGNFNDIPHVFNAKRSLRDPVAFLEQAKAIEVWPLVVLTDGHPLRSALLYVSAGWTARAAAQFDNPDVRRKITSGSAGLRKSLLRLTLYYFKTRQGSLLPAFKYNEKLMKKTDLLFANGPEVARLFRTGRHFYRGESFLFCMLDVRRLLLSTPFLISSLFGRMRAKEVNSVVLQFTRPADFPLQCDGEVVELENVAKLEVVKAKKPVMILKTK